jgi:hypothetical protein
MRESYRDGPDHFRHVLQCLFKPGVEKAGYKPIPPIAKGSDLIHAEIINNLESADLVLCDMSCLNPNVFFEFGIRTSLNKPVCVVKDELTEKVPFDTVMLNYQEYKSTLEPWELDSEITKLAAHVKASAERSKGENTLWRHFGIRTAAGPYQGETGVDAKLDYLTMQMDSLRQKMDAIEHAPSLPATDDMRERQSAGIALVERMLPEEADVKALELVGETTIVVHYTTGTIPDEKMREIQWLAFVKHGVSVTFRGEQPPGPTRNGDK